MQIGISIVLSFLVLELRLNDDVPTQSDSVPLINVYFTLCMSFALSTLVWISLRHKLIEDDYVPSWIRFIVINYLWYIMCISRWGFKNESKSKSSANTNKKNIKIMEAEKYKNLNVYIFFTNERKRLLIPKNKKMEFLKENNLDVEKFDKSKITNIDIIKVLNFFLFLSFLFYIICVHLIGLVILPLFFKKPLTIND